MSENAQAKIQAFFDHLWPQLGHSLYKNRAKIQHVVFELCALEDRQTDLITIATFILLMGGCQKCTLTCTDFYTSISNIIWMEFYLIYLRHLITVN